MTDRIVAWMVLLLLVSAVTVVMMGLYVLAEEYTNDKTEECLQEENR